VSANERQSRPAPASAQCAIAVFACILTLWAPASQGQQSAADGASGFPGDPDDESTATAGRSDGDLQPVSGHPPGLRAEKQPGQRPSWFFSPSLSFSETVTDNGTYGASSTPRKADFISNLSAGLRIVGSMPRLQVQADYSVRDLVYARGSQSGQVVPAGNLNARLEPIEEHLFVDATVTSTRVLQNPLAPIPSLESTLNNSTFNAERVAPDLRGQISNFARYRLRSENAWTQTTPENTAQPDAYVGNHTVEIEQNRSKLRLGLNGQREQTRFRSSASREKTDDSVRATLRIFPEEEFGVGLRYGLERNDYGLLEADRSGRIYGADLAWRPTLRTDVEGYVERRLLGDRWDLRAKHRTALLAFVLSSSRATTTSPAAMLAGSGGADIASLLDAIYTARYPDPVERARVVNEIISAEGLPTALAGPIGTLAPYVTRIGDHRLTVVAHGRRVTLAFGLYDHRNETLRGSVIASAPVGTAIDSFQIVGASASFSLRLAPNTTATAALTSNRATGIGPFEGRQTTENAYRLSLSEALSRRLDAVVGAQHRTQHSNFVAPGEENSLSAGFAWHL